MGPTAGAFYSLLSVMHSPCATTQLNRLMEGHMAKQAFFSSRTLSRVAAACALTAAAMSSHAAIEVFTSGTTFFKRVITNTSVNVTSATTFADVPGTLTTVFVPAGSAVLVSVSYDAEAACYGGGVNNPNWCELMVNIGGVEGSPQASTTSLGDTYAFASTDNGAASVDSWRGHAMSRHRCIRNTSAAPLAVAVSMKWKILQFGADTSTFWLDDSAMVIEMSSGCTVTPVPSVSDGLAPTPGTGQGQRVIEKR
jgi:hypothetical protein